MNTIQRLEYLSSTQPQRVRSVRDHERLEDGILRIIAGGTMACLAAQLEGPGRTLAGIAGTAYVARGVYDVLRS